MKYGVLIILLILSFVTGNCQLATYLFIGTYTDTKPGKGIYVYQMNRRTGKLTLTGTGEQVTNPSFLTLSPDGKYLYACTETKTALPGSISGFSIDSLHGQIKFINKQSSAGANPVYCIVDKSNRFIVTGNYTEGNVTVLGRNNDGSLNTALQTIQFAGSSIDSGRQDKPHIHSTIFSPDNHYLYLPDLGTDKIRVFGFEAGAALPLIEMDSLTVNTFPGSGPRHMVFHPTKNVAYCIEEMGGAVSVYRYTNGKLAAVQRINANKKKAATYSSADIHVSPDGLFLYISNRIENTLAIFSILANGNVKLIGHQSTLGEVPRNFCIDPSGDFLLVANQLTNNIVVFKRNATTGLLKPTGIAVSVPAPSCLQMKIYGSH